MKSSTVPWICPGLPGIIQNIYHSCLGGMKLPISYSYLWNSTLFLLRTRVFFAEKREGLKKPVLGGKDWVSAY